LADDSDASVTGQTTWYADTDADTFGDADASIASCDLPNGHVADATDCDDTRADVSPAGTEVSDDGVDQDCDGSDATSAVGDDTGDDVSEDEAGGCGCTTASPDVSVLAMALALGVAVRRRRDGAAAR
jgi:MYXO-CTERM domain-containing protein